ncbi:MAG: LLM class flavin-dependent oxidoreductase [Candidatus Rokubacteria bacterium]|nr:LLM class flavin-dependent oxidoreductase [Candidatus Rokubacteria bacterium]
MRRVKPAVSLVAVPGRRRATLDLAQKIEREGFTGIYCPSPGDGLALCHALALVTREIALGTSIAHIYTRHALEFAQGAAIVHELSGGRFRFGIGVSHGPAHERLGIRPRFVTELRSYDKQVGGLPPITLATLRQKMVALAGEIAQGAVWANAARSHMPASLAQLPAPARTDPAFFIGDMIPTCIDDDRNAAAAVMRKTLLSYAKLPNYQNYWIEAGYEDEMRAVREAIARRDEDGIAKALSDRWLRDVTLFGSASEVRDGVEAWRAAGVKTVILVPSSTRGGQLVAFDELIRAFA